MAHPEYETIIVSDDPEAGAAVRHIRLNRPDRMNAYTIRMCKDMVEAFQAADVDPTVRVVVVTGEGPGFCAGADIEGGFGNMSGGERMPEVNGVERDSGGVMNLVVYEMDTPVIAGVHRAAVGIGCTMLFAMDIVVAAPGTKFALPFTRRGIVFDGVASWLLPRLVGLAKARDWSVTGRTFLANEAREAGMIAELADDPKARATEIARDIAANCAPQSVAGNKELLRLALGEDGEAMAAHMRESDMLNARFVSADCAEGVASFFEKRAPRFADKPA